MIDLTHNEIKLLRRVLPKFVDWENHKTTLYGVLQQTENGRKAWDEQTLERVNGFIETQVNVLKDK